MSKPGMGSTAKILSLLLMRRNQLPYQKDYPLFCAVSLLAWQYHFHSSSFRRFIFHLMSLLGK